MGTARSPDSRCAALQNGPWYRVLRRRRTLNNLPQIVQLARRQVGEHYLWGGRGEIPGGGTACSLPARNVSMAPDSFDQRAPIVRTAIHPQFHAYCAGRWGTKSGGRPFDPRDTDLINYLEQQKFKPPERVQDYFGFTPPKVSGGQYTDIALVWGEPCNGKRHFDCVGFLNWILSNAFGSAFVWNISDYRTKYASQNQHFDLVAERFNPQSHKLLPGDIAVSGTEHIGFVVSPNELVEAMDARHGVVLSALPARIVGWLVLRPH